MAVEELYDRALSLTNERRFREARELLERATDQPASDDLAARIVGTLAYAVAQLGELDRGEQLCREALRRTGLSPHTRGILTGQLASLLFQHGRPDEALAGFAEALAALDDDPWSAANLRMNRSIVLMQRFDMDAAVADIEAAVDAYLSHGEATDVAEARHNLGYAHLLRGDLLRAIREMSRARPAIAAVSSANAAICDVDMAEAYAEAGLVTEAEGLLQSAAEIFGDEHIVQAQGEAELLLARSLLRHEPHRAREVARAAGRRFARIGATVWRARADGIRMRAALAAGAVDRTGEVTGIRGRLPTAVEVSRVVAALRRARLRNDADALELTRLLWRVRRGLPARRGPRTRPGTSIEVWVLADELRAERAARAGRGGEARRIAADGVERLARWRAAFGSIDLQTASAMHGVGLMVVGLEAAHRTGDPGVLFEWAERARHDQQHVTPLRPPPDPELAADLAELRLLRAETGGIDWLSDPRAVEASARVRRRQWVQTRARRVDAAATLPELRAALDPDTAALLFVFRPARLSCLVVTDDRADIVDLPGGIRDALGGLRADLDMSAQTIAGPMAEVVGRSLDRRLQALSAALVAVPLAHTAARRLVITAPGVLAGVPWTMLPGLSGRAVTLAASASLWVRAGEAPALQRAAFVAGPRVARGAEELAGAAAAWPRASQTTGDRASVEAVTALAASADVLHIAAHGTHSADNGMFAGLELADGTLFGYDIDRMPRVPSIVVLSACEVGRSTVRWGEEALGMTRAWLHAGVRCVISAPVSVGDADACLLLPALHRGLAAGVTPAEALVAATLQTGIAAPFQCHGAGL
ncbi:CHAT domain-containing protein [Microbacterium sp.]|uniref:CHAT domain-containing protein n=1 Tax=Microbacterium sp. TaxID=51671 RepID=UPI003A88804E